MLAAIVPYLVALSAMSFAALSAVTLIHYVNRFDPPDVDAAVATAQHPNVPVTADKSKDLVAA